MHNVAMIPGEIGHAPVSNTSTLISINSHHRADKKMKRIKLSDGVNETRCEVGDIPYDSGCDSTAADDHGVDNDVLDDNTSVQLRGRCEFLNCINICKGNKTRCRNHARVRQCLIDG